MDSINNKQFFKRFLKCPAFCLAIMLLLCSTAIAQFPSNPNQVGETITIELSDSVYNEILFTNDGTIDNWGTIGNRFFEKRNTAHMQIPQPGYGRFQYSEIVTCKQWYFIGKVEK